MVVTRCLITLILALAGFASAELSEAQLRSQIMIM